MSTIQQVLTKLQKLKQQATAAPDILSLEKVSNKIDKIRDKLSDYRNNKQLFGILDKIDLLIKQKNKYFRQIIIKNSSKLIKEDLTRNQEADKTLKYSKSAQNVKLIPSKKTIDSLRRNQQTHIESSKNLLQIHDQSDTKNHKNKLIKDKTVHIRSARDQKQQNNQEMSEMLQTSSVLLPTQIPEALSKRNIKSAMSTSMKNIKKAKEDQLLDTDLTAVNYQSGQHQQKKKLHNQIDFLQQKLSFSFKQIQDLTKKVSSLQNVKQKNIREVVQHTSPMSKTYIAKQQQIVDDYSKKLRQKSFMIEDLKAKMEYYKAMNEELKNRVINEGRRNEDYCTQFKSEIKKLNKQVERLQRQNENLTNDLDDLEQKNQGLVNQIKKLVTKLEQQTKDKQNTNKSLKIAAAAKTKQLQKQVQRLKGELFNMSKLEVALQHEQQQKQQLKQFIDKLQKRIQDLQIQCKRFNQERDKSQLQVYKLQQQQKYLKSELRLNIEAKQILAEQLLSAKQKLQQQLRVTNLLQYENELKSKNKLNKLKQIKGLLTELR